MSRFSRSRSSRQSRAVPIKKAVPRRARWKGPLETLGMHALTVAGIVGIGTLCLLLVASIGVYTYFVSTLPSPDRLEGRSEAQSTKIMDRNGELLYEVFDANSGGRRTVVPITEIPAVLKAATIATEDPSFYSNPGVDIRGILRAIYYNVRYGIPVGGSTITQQLVKKTLLTPEQTITRKIYEAFLAIEVTREYPKDKILEMYLNTIYYGNMAYGIEAASQTYFNKHAKDLTLAEASLLAGLPKAPATFDPCTDPSAALGRQRVVLNLMADANYISSGQVDATAAETAQEIKSDTFSQRCRQGVGIKAPHFVTFVRELLEEQYGPEVVYAGGLNVTTTLDMKMQKVAEEEAQKQIAALKAQHVTNAALVAIDPKTGQILAMLGSADFFDKKIDGQVNVALQLRQPGSSIKPINYVAAFEKGWSPATVLADVTTHFPIQGHPDYVPHNYDMREHGLVPVRTALASSFNIPAVKTLQYVTVPTMIDMAKRFGITTFKDPKNYGLALTLGGGDVELLELTSAYAVFPNQGIRMAPIPFLKITDSTGRVLYDARSQKGTQVVDPRYAYQIVSILSDVSARAPGFGTGAALRLSRPAFAKTGTTDDWRDNWTLGGTPDLVTGVWVGNSDNTPMEHSSGITGAAPLWHNFMERVTAGTPVHDFVEPPGMQWVEVCNESGLLPTDLCPPDHRHKDIFLTERVPTQPDNVWQKIRIDKTNNLVAVGNCPPDTVEEKVFAVYPPEARQYAIDHNIPQPPTDPSPNCPNPVEPAPPGPTPGGINPSLGISTPGEGSTVNGTVTIRGTVQMPDFDHYTIQIGFGGDPQDWIQLVNAPNSIQNSTLATWDTTRFPDGSYTIRVAMYDHSGKNVAGRVHVTIANTPAPTARPTATPTRTSTPVPTLPRPSATATLRRPTNTPVPPTKPPPTATQKPPAATPKPHVSTPTPWGHAGSPTAAREATAPSTSTPTRTATARATTQTVMEASTATASPVVTTTSTATFTSTATRTATPRQ